MWFVILEILLMGIFTFVIWKFSFFIQVYVKNFETEISQAAKKISKNKIDSLLLALGHGRIQSEIWWNQQWHITIFLSCGTFLIMALTKEFTWILLPGLFILFQYYFLLRRAKDRKNKILKRIPFILDILILNLEAGLDFISSLEELIKINDEHPLHHEIRITLQSIQMGETRSIAFENLGKRTQVSELTQLAGVISQSETMGSSLIELLRLQSREIRYRIFKQAESEAQKAPVKILIPMLLLIFPVVFILLFVPIALQMLSSFS